MVKIVIENPGEKEVMVNDWTKSKLQLFFCQIWVSGSLAVCVPNETKLNHIKYSDKMKESGNGY